MPELNPKMAALKANVAQLAKIVEAIDSAMEGEGAVELRSLKAGQQVGARRFTLVKPLGRGGMGVVWLAHDTRLDESVALKFLPLEISSDSASLDNLRRETVRSHHLTHPNIIRIHDFQESDEVAFISMEHVDGMTLSDWRLQQSRQVLSWEQLVPLVRQLCAALEYAHGENVIHRDLKPSNMMVDSKGRLKLADFGIAALASDSASSVSARHANSGTPPYMSPQQLAGKRPEVTDDIYALGATLYELLTGRPPFYTGDIRDKVMNQVPEPMEERLAVLGIDNDIPPAVGAMVMACMAKDPGQRPQSARAVAEWIGLELETKTTSEGLAAALFPQRRSDSEAVADEATERGGSKPTGLGWKRAAVGTVWIVALVMAAAFWLGRYIFPRDHSSASVAAGGPAQTAEVGVQQKPSSGTPATTPAAVPTTSAGAYPPSQGTMTNLAASNGAEWISSEVPKPGADGWIVLFDGKRLFGCSAPTADIASGKIRIQDGCLRLDSGKLYFNIIGRDVMIRARMKKMSCQNCGVRVRDDGKGCDNGKGRDCGATFDGGNLFIVGHHIDGPFMHLASVHARGDYDEFFEMEFDAEGGNLTLKIDGQIICHAQDNSITEGAMCADANGGSALFQSIEARILDKTPSLGTSATGPAATPTPSAIGQVKYAITDLGTLGGGFSCPKAINDSGLVVGYANTSASQSHAFLSDGKAPMRDLGTLDSTRVLSTAMDINNNGQIVGWSWSTNVKAHAFLCGASTPMKDLGTLSGADSWAGCINDRGEIVGEANLSDGQYRAFLYTGSGPMRSIGTLGGTKSAAASINNSGQIVGWSHLSAASSGYAFLYSDSSPMRSLGTLGGSTSHACGINDRGQVVGWSTTRNGTTHAFLYAGNGPMRDLGTLGGTTSGAWCIDNDGHILGYSYDSSDNDHPFLYSGSGPMRDLNSLIPASSGWTLISTKGMEADPPKRMINSSGQIVCLGRNGLGQSHALLLSPLPSKLQDAASAKSDSTKNASASQRAATPD